MQQQYGPYFIRKPDTCHVAPPACIVAIVLVDYLRDQPHCTGGVEKFSAKENIRKMLKVSHFYLVFSSNKN